MKTYDCTGKKKVWDDSAYRAWKSNREMWDEVERAGEMVKQNRHPKPIKEEPCQN